MSVTELVFHAEMLRLKDPENRLLGVNVSIGFGGQNGVKQQKCYGESETIAACISKLNSQQLSCRWRATDHQGGSELARQEESQEECRLESKHGGTPDRGVWEEGVTS